MLNALAVAVQGIGFSAFLVGAQGFGAIESVAAPAPRPGGYGGGAMYQSFVPREVQYDELAELQELAELLMMAKSYG
jgi:hypothetical protein